MLATWHIVFVKYLWYHTRRRRDNWRVRVSSMFAKSSLGQNVHGFVEWLPHDTRWARASARGGRAPSPPLREVELNHMSCVVVSYYFCFEKVLTTVMYSTWLSAWAQLMRHMGCSLFVTTDLHWVILLTRSGSRLGARVPVQMFWSRRQCCCLAHHGDPATKTSI